ncbi:hypothetical protein VW35_09055 [Devosia soli]|uniref:Secreted protein n=1 Tax=Devosia soli TaxID=361041 RepID=A0A0F5L8U1_9HYPH|nr:hypothetical protein [Devosia soli]KKB78665.1 hypothetical protein VW35_09055 [Devosia soli]
MKTTAIAFATAFALSLGGVSMSFAQDATNSDATNPEECLIEQGAGATPPNESLSSETTSGDSGSSSEGTRAIDDQNPGGCTNIVESEESDSN